VQNANDCLKIGLVRKPRYLLGLPVLEEVGIEVKKGFSPVLDEPLLPLPSHSYIIAVYI
jgi:hypothetical protein